MVKQVPPHSSSALQHLPPLESGDRLTRPEFERRYAAAADIKKAELIEGIVYVASPLRLTPHAEPHSRLVTWLGTYTAFTPGTRSGIEPTVRLVLPAPDGMICSRVFPGLWLAVEALLSNQMAHVLEVLQQGLRSPENAAFVEQLQQQL